MQDHIGDRLNHPERVAPEFRHLMADDRARVELLCHIPIDDAQLALDVGSSDGAMVERLRQAHPQLELHASDITPTYPLVWDVRTHPPDDFPRLDLIYCCEVLEHLSFADVKKALKQIVNFLRPGGALVVTVPNFAVAVKYQVGCRDRWRWPDHRSYWTFRTLGQYLRHAGFATWQWYTLYAGDTVQDGIWLVVKAKLKP